MERLKRIKENLVNCVESQINGNMQEVNTKELSEDITEMISGATTEEKTILKQKLAQLTNKIA